MTIFIASFVFVVLAEMGDKTQLMTMALAAEEAVKIGGAGWIAKAEQIVPVWMGTTCGMMIADAFGIVVGIVLHKHVPEKLIKWIAASCFAVFGLLGLHEALDQLLTVDVAVHHSLLIASVILLPTVMWLISRLTEKRILPLTVGDTVDAQDASKMGRGVNCDAEYRGKTS